jgi:glycosyltransferase involved in cell wall biosynthesis
MGVQAVFGHGRMTRLVDVAPVGRPAPRLSVIVAARNEERKIEEAMRSLLTQDYPNLELIAVDDRSSDATGEIIDGLAATHRALRPVHIDELPAGWLGKLHALHAGAELATGEILLFADADVVMESTVLSRAVGHMLRNDVDHLTIGSEMRTGGAPLLDVAIGAFLFELIRIGQPWRASDPNSRRYAGLGAFNMVWAEAYHAVGGHESIRMHPVDDLELGRLIKAEGYRQEMLLGTRMMEIEWYPSTRALVRGLRKNGFAAASFSVPMVAAIAATILAFDVWPWLALLVTDGITRALNAGVVLTGMAGYWLIVPNYGLNRWLAPLLPVGAIVILDSGLVSTVTTLWRGGITWRGTFYPLAELRRSRSASGSIERGVIRSPRC